MPNETVEIDVKEICSPKKYPSAVIAVAQMNEAIRNMREVNLTFVCANPATIGMKALIEGMSFPKKIHHMPRFENVSLSALWTLVKVASSMRRIFRARGFSYFLISKKMITFPIVFPRAPAMTVGTKRSDVVLTR